VFVVDITFQGDKTSAERIFVRRPYVTVGASESSHVVVTEMASLGLTLQIQRDLARSFKVLAFSADGRPAPSFVGGTYDGRASIELGPVSFGITALDLDLLLRENEALDRAGVRILRRAFSDTLPEFPALFVSAPIRALLSFRPDQPLTVGRARTAAVRLDVPTVSLQHARIGYESGEFWVEDLGSTNGTFVEDKQVSSRISVGAGIPIHVSKNACVVGVTSHQQIAEIDDPTSARRGASASVEALFPSLLSVAEVARPSRLVLKPGQRIEVGRDPSCGLWLGAPHISRRHCVIELSKSGVVTISDTSTNGTAFDGGVLRNQDSFQTSEQPLVLDFGAGITVALCFSAQHEKVFQAAYGDPTAFKRGATAHAASEHSGRSRAPRERRSTTWFNMDLNSLEQLHQANGKMGKMRAMFGGLTGPGRVAMALIGFCFVGLLVLMGTMVVSGLRW
jgi:pSer/pThr/pTyr-binding forkhead associated (FHA) protein